MKFLLVEELSRLICTHTHTRFLVTFVANLKRKLDQDSAMSQAQRKEHISHVNDNYT